VTAAVRPGRVNPQEGEVEVQEGTDTPVLGRSRVVLALALLAIACFAAACGGDDDNGSASAGGGSATTAKEGGKVAPAGSAENPFGATLANGTYGENYNPPKDIIDHAIYGPNALPADPTQKNIVLAGMARVPAQVDQDKALECWKKNTCETGTGGKLTVGLADGFGGNVARQIFKMEFILQALTYKDIGKIVYTDANLDTQKAISDVRSMIAQGVNVIVSYPDAGKALLPAYRQATQRDIPVALWSNANIGKPGTDYLTFSGQDVCALGKSYAEIFNKELADGGEIAFLGGTPGNTQSPAWQKCEKEALNPNIKVVATADTNWTRQGALQAMSGILSKYPDLKGFSYDYGDATVGVIRAFKAAGKPLNVIATVQSDDNPLLCAWKKEGNPDFKVWVQSALFTQGRTALTAAMMKQQGAPIPAEIIFQPSLRQVDENSCRADVPANGSPSSTVPTELQTRMFGK
jgi:ABC-type sugar transport system substrate-binding protein